jgi:hypothetical protein
MNMFKALDSYFPVGAARLSGEVVSLSIFLKFDRFLTLGQKDTVVSWKRKQWYVNASVNAFHMHRGLVHEASVAMNLHGLSQSRSRQVNRLIAVAVAISYSNNYLNGDQYYEMIIDNVSDSNGPVLWLCNTDIKDGDRGLAITSEASRSLVTEIEELIHGFCKLEA